MKTESQVEYAEQVVACRVQAEEDSLSIVQYGVLCGIVAALSWVLEYGDGSTVQALLDGRAIAPGVTEQEAEYLMLITRRLDASRN